MLFYRVHQHFKLRCNQGKTKYLHLLAYSIPRLKLSVPMLVRCVFIFSFQIAHRIRTGVQGLGEACISLIQSGGAVQSRPKDPFSKKELADNCRHVAEKVCLD